MEPLLYIGIAQALFVAVFMLCRQRNVLSDKIVAVWMVFLASPLLFQVGRLYPDLSAFRLFSIRSFPLTFGPFLWLYTNILIDKKRSITPGDLVHFAPFAVFALVQIVFLDQSMPPQADMPPPVFPGHAMPPGGHVPPLLSGVFERVDGIANVLSSCCYSAIVLSLLKKHKRHTFSYFSSLPIRVTLSWLQWLTIGFVISFLLPLISTLWPISPLSQAHTLSFTGFIYVLSFFGLQQPPVFQQSGEPAVSNPSSSEAVPLEETPPPEESQNDETPVGKDSEQKYQRSGLTQDQAQRYLQRLEAYMQHEKPYLEADLTIEALARRLHISRHYLTQVLNERLGKNFYLYVNDYRIHEAKQRLLEPDNAHLTILSIAYESGFNSKSTFNTVFKKITDMTPSQFRKSQIQS